MRRHRVPPVVAPEPQPRARLRDFVGPDEILLTCALMLLTIGLWSAVGRVALIAPGLVLLWVSLPARRPLLVTPQAGPDQAEQKGTA